MRKASEKSIKAKQEKDFYLNYFTSQTNLPKELYNGQSLKYYYNKGDFYLKKMRFYKNPKNENEKMKSLFYDFRINNNEKAFSDFSVIALEIALKCVKLYLPLRKPLYYMQEKALEVVEDIIKRTRLFPNYAPINPVTEIWQCARKLICYRTAEEKNISLEEFIENCLTAPQCNDQLKELDACNPLTFRHSTFRHSTFRHSTFRHSTFRHS